MMKIMNKYAIKRTLDSSIQKFARNYPDSDRSSLKGRHSSPKPYHC